MSYDEETHDKYWNDTREIINSLPKNNVICWYTDNNGQITQEENKEYIGKWTIGNRTEEGYGRQLEKMCKETN